MGVVYKAEDTKLRRVVSLKFLAPRIHSDEEERARFLQEARAVAALDHPNVCAIYEVGEAAGQPYLAMAYVQGETLASKIDGQPLPAKQVLDYAAQIAEGLCAAHEAAIVHRDIKSANVMLTPKGQIKIMDFGVAQFASDGGPREVVGTASYMSPEQTSGEAVDARTDIWSFGVVMYELLTGHLPFRGEYEAAVLYSVLNEEPEPIDSPDVPAKLIEIVRKCLQKNPSQRYPTTDALAADLRALRAGDATTQRGAAVDSAGADAPRRARFATMGVAAMILLLLVVAWGVWGPFRPPSGTAGSIAGSQEQRPSLVVLPLQSLSGNDEEDYFVDGMTDELITSLAKIRGLRVISRTSAMQFKGTRKTMPEIAQQLRVEYVLEGSVLRAGDRVRINAQLIDTAQDRSVWAENYDYDLKDVLSLQNDAAKTIAREIRVQISPQEQARLGRPPAINPQAYENYLRARFFINRRANDDLAHAQDLFQQVIDQEPASGLGYAGLADALTLTALRGEVPPSEIWPKAEAAALRAVELDSDLAEAHSSLGLIRSFYDWDWAGAGKEFDTAIDLHPGNAIARQRRAIYLSRIGRHDEAIEEIQSARDLDPLSLVINHTVGVIYSMARRYDEAVSHLETNLELSDTNYRTYMTLGRSRLEQGKFDAAIKSLRKASDLSGHNPFVVGALAYGYARSGDEAEARRLLADIEKQAAERYVSPITLAMIRIGLGERDQAFALLDEALKERSSFLLWLKVEPVFDPLRGDPRFAKLLADVGLAG